MHMATHVDDERREVSVMTIEPMAQETNRSIARLLV